MRRILKIFLTFTCLFVMCLQEKNIIADDTQNDESGKSKQLQQETQETTKQEDVESVTVQSNENQLNKASVIDIYTQTDLENAIKNASSHNKVLVLKNDILLTKRMAMVNNIDITIDGDHYTINRGVGGFLFTIPQNSNLKLMNITINGKKETSFTTASEPLIQVNGGNLILSTDTILENNRAENDWGGAVSLRGTYDNSITMESNSIIRNCEAKNGGAIFGGKQGATPGYGKVDIIVKDSAQLANNMAYGTVAFDKSGNGGAIAVSETTNFGVVNIDIRDNVLISGNKTHGYGGAVYSVLRNPASKINIDGATFTNNSTFSNITTNSGGGALFFTIEGSGENSTIDINNAKITNNVTGTSANAGLGGGIYFRYLAPTDNVSIRNSTISSNVSNEGGGAGIYFQTVTSEAVSAVFSNNVISQNKVDSLSRSTAGAGVYVNASGKVDLDFNGTSITNNSLSSIVETKGAGVYLHTSSEVSLSDININNHSADKGGAIYSNANLHLKNAVIVDNIASNEGGAVYSNSTIEIINSVMENNQAKNGGAFYSNRNSSISSTIMKNNKSTVNGGAIYNGGTLALKESDVQSNTGIKGSGIYNKGSLNLWKGNTVNGLYILDAKAIPVVQEKLTDTTIQLEESVHVSSTNQSTPIVIALHSENYPLLNDTDKSAFVKPTVNFEKHVNLLSDSILTNSNANSEVWLYYGTYEISYTLNGGTNDLNNPLSYNYGTGVDSFESPERKGYDFIGWYEDPLFINKISNISKTHQGNINLYAKWKASEYMITYELDGGVNDLNNPTKYVFGMGVTSFDKPTKEGYHFAGWYDSPLFSNKVTGVSATTAEDIKLYAKWEASEYKITYELDGGINHLNNPTKYVFGTGVTSFDKPTKEGYHFAGWYDSPLFTNKVTSVSATTTEDIKLYAKWEAINYTIDYELDGGINHLNNPTKYVFGTGVTSFDKPTKEGYNFAGWYDSPLFTNKVTSVSATTAEDIKLYAKWEAINYTIDYELDGGINNPNNLTSYTTETGVSQFYAPTKEGYDFIMWTDDKGKEITNVPENTVGNIILYAKWEAKGTSIVDNETPSVDARPNIDGSNTTSNEEKNQKVDTSDKTTANIYLITQLTSLLVIATLKKLRKSH
ncbi:InlB B-repeat-containing protein [Breznakia pachnodae]|uniref:Repeat protein (TIGR02543 family) n=1 Tax=Breznakia pachnodae TaxID=265178 RepID=A0ABU0E157_9FIRM|nr:InlB B-repeat-containing protein [Breznakia pachnodae]MDQ0360458.1 putative repeat protein (TIGR02543 family) [Breznakia pachnodae]